MGKKILTVFVMLFCLPFVIGCDVFSSVTTETITTLDVGYDYDDFSDWMITDTAFQLSQPETDYYIYFYGEYCISCMEVKQEALGIISGLENSVIYFAEASKLSDINENISVTKTPSLVHVVNNVETESWVGGESVILALRNLT